MQCPEQIKSETHITVGNNIADYTMSWRVWDPW